ncbi:hypothetical protein VKT23_010379 [Stygiomarasmius scandens]|uniref:Uncharacterized protein n=1 Tax=Marasmiellus scandens TaxID=2682957 RepID=A0ABR1JE64_9AGAR
MSKAHIPLDTLNGVNSLLDQGLDDNNRNSQPAQIDNPNQTMDIEDDRDAEAEGGNMDEAPPPENEENDTYLHNECQVYIVVCLGETRKMTTITMTKTTAIPVGAGAKITGILNGK